VNAYFYPSSNPYSKMRSPAAREAFRFLKAFVFGVIGSFITEGQADSRILLSSVLVDCSSDFSWFYHWIAYYLDAVR
jgi:hypothetical protein